MAVNFDASTDAIIINFAVMDIVIIITLFITEYLLLVWPLVFHDNNHSYYV